MKLYSFVETERTLKRQGANRYIEVRLLADDHDEVKALAEWRVASDGTPTLDISSDLNNVLVRVNGKVVQP